MKIGKCPVCGWKVENAVKVQVADNEIVVCCADCAKAVMDDPSKFTGGPK